MYNLKQYTLIEKVLVKKKSKNDIMNNYHEMDHLS